MPPAAMPYAADTLRAPPLLQIRAAVDDTALILRAAPPMARCADATPFCFDYLGAKMRERDGARYERRAHHAAHVPIPPRRYVARSPEFSHTRGVDGMRRRLRRASQAAASRGDVLVMRLPRRPPPE